MSISVHKEIENGILLGVLKTDISECLLLINSGLLVFFRLIFDQEVYFRVLPHPFYG